jgi:predicted O-methyltransferase YrrM
MIYEFTIGLRTIRKEGFASLLQKISLYFRQIARGINFLTMRMPHGAPLEKTIDFSFTAAGKLIEPLQNRSEIFPFATLLQQRKPRVVVEIGTANGGTLFVWCAVADPNAVIISIDLPGGIHGGGYPRWKSFIYRKFAKPKQTLHLLRVDSHLSSTRDRLKAILPPGGIDFLFIDGDHTYEGVKKDFELYSPLVRRGGIVAFHDICLHPPEQKCDVDKLWLEIKTKYKTWEFIENPKQDLFGIGVLEIQE